MLLPAASSGEAKTILLVEDEQLVREVLGQVLQEGGYTVLEAPDGETALQVARDYSSRIWISSI